MSKSDGFSIAASPLLFGENSDPGLVAVEHVTRAGAPDEMLLLFRREGAVVEEREPFEPFILADVHAIADCPVPYRALGLKGRGKLNVRACFAGWKEYLAARRWLQDATGRSPSAPDAPYLCLNDPVHQHLLVSGRTLFLGMPFEELSRMQVDIECLTSEGYEFCNAEREGDRIIAIAMCDHTGWIEVLSGVELDEKTLLQRFVEILKQRDPDVIEGHNIFNFDLPYITERARRHRVKLALGRDGSAPRRRPSRFSVGERTISYDRFDIFGRHVVDTLFLVNAYDISHRSLSGFGLKEVALHFGVAASDRVYIEGRDIAGAFRSRPADVMKYVRDDVVETREIGRILSRSAFTQAQMLPYSYQNVCVRGMATKIDSMMVREYVRQERAVPVPGRVRGFAGGYTDMFVEGIVENVHHCDVRSLYPSLMLTRGLAPATDELGVFLKLLDQLKDFRVRAKDEMDACRSKDGRVYLDALQSTFKVLINSFYGYLGFAQGRFNDFDSAEAVAGQGRELLRAMIEWLRAHGAVPVEIDTDGIYFTPPPATVSGGSVKRTKALDEFRQAFAASLPDGIEVEFDGDYESMYSYKMKNYALLTREGEMIIKGAALKSRGLEPFQRSFVEEVVRLKLEGHGRDIPKLKAGYEKAIREREWSIDRLAKTERLQDAPATYTAKRGKAGRARSAAYELALASDREYRAGDQVSYYVTGAKKSVAVHECAKMISAWDPERRDENVAYYLAKLDALYKKFGREEEQTELGI
ncbi:DNA polymerase domain-containing protein [Verrucomicrobiota bacterium]